MKLRPLSRNVIPVFVLIFILKSNLYAQNSNVVNDSLDRSLQAINNALADIQRKLADVSKVDTSYFRFIKQMDRFDFKISKIEQWDYYNRKFNAKPQLQYKQQLNTDLGEYVRLMRKLIDSVIIDKDSVAMIISYLDQDISCKTSGAWAASPLPPSLVDVKVRVFDKSTGKEIPAIRVFMRGEFSSEHLTREFNPTVNAQEKVIPGVKYVWIMRGADKVGERTTTVPSEVELYTIDFYLDN